MRESGRLSSQRVTPPSAKRQAGRQTFMSTLKRIAVAAGVVATLGTSAGHAIAGGTDSAERGVGVGGVRAPSRLRPAHRRHRLDHRRRPEHVDRRQHAPVHRRRGQHHPADHRGDRLPGVPRHVRRSRSRVRGAAVQRRSAGTDDAVRAVGRLRQDRDHAVQRRGIHRTPRRVERLWPRAGSRSGTSWSSPPPTTRARSCCRSRSRARPNCRSCRTSSTRSTPGRVSRR